MIYGAYLKTVLQEILKGHAIWGSERNATALAKSMVTVYEEVILYLNILGYILILYLNEYLGSLRCYRAAILKT